MYYIQSICGSEQERLQIIFKDFHKQHAAVLFWQLVQGGLGCALGFLSFCPPLKCTVSVSISMSMLRGTY